MMDGRVKTLHPKVHGGILARRADPAHVASAREHGIGLIDLVVVNLYPFAAAAANPATPFDRLVEEIDIGGPEPGARRGQELRRRPGGGGPGDYPAVLEATGPAGRAVAGVPVRSGAKSLCPHRGLRRGHRVHAGAGVGVGRRAGAPRRSGDAVAADAWPSRSCATCATGKTRTSPAAWYAPARRTGLGDAAVLQGKELSYTNLLDLDAAARIVLEFAEPAAVVVKHTNPCGVATGADAADAYVRAREADALSAFGGIVALNRAIDAEAARAIASTRIDAVIAPAVHDDAREALARKPQMRVVTADFSQLAAGADLELRSILGAVLVQERDRVVEASGSWPTADLRVVTRRSPTAGEWQALRFAWRVMAHVKSNTVIFTHADRTVAIGAGQMSRVDAVQVARLKAQSIGPDALRGTVAASDAFFPFRDGLDAVAAAGATAVVQPGGSVKDDEVIAAADEHGLAMVFTGRRHFRH